MKIREIVYQLLREVMDEVELHVKNPYYEEKILRIKEEKEEYMEFTCSEIATTSEYVISDLKQEIADHLENVLEKVEFQEKKVNQHDIKLEIKDEKEDNLESEDCKLQEIVDVVREAVEEVDFRERKRHKKRQPRRTRSGRLPSSRNALGCFIKYVNKKSDSKIRRGICTSELEKLTSSCGGVKLGRRYSRDSPIAHRTRSKLYRKSKRIGKKNCRKHLVF